MGGLLKSLNKRPYGMDTIMILVCMRSNVCDMMGICMLLWLILYILRHYFVLHMLVIHGSDEIPIRITHGSFPSQDHQGS